MQRFTAIRIPGSNKREFTLAFPQPVTLRALDEGRAGYRFDARVRFSATPPELRTSTSWRTETSAYEYRLLDRNHRERLVYHWQPESAGPRFPHLHVSASLDAQFDALTRQRIELDKRHLATGQVSLQSVVRMLITEFGIRSLHPDWEARLEQMPTH